MSSFFTPFKVGLLIIASVVVFIFMFGTLNESVLKRDGGYTVHAYLDDASGLAEQSRVMLSGIAVGEVKAIKLEDRRARVEIKMREDVELYSGVERTLANGETQLVDAATLNKKSASLLGDFYLEITPGLRGEVLEDGDEIPIVVLPVSTDELMRQMSDLGENLELISHDIKDITGTMSDVFGDPETGNRLRRILSDVEELTHTLQNIATTNEKKIDTIVSNVEGMSRDLRTATNQTSQSVDQILADVEAVTSEVRYIIGQNSQDVAEGIGTVTSTLASLQLALDNLNYSLENIQEITDDVADGEGTLGRLVTDDTIARQTERAVTSAADLLESINRLETWVELRSEYAIQNRSFKNYFRLSLRPNPNKFYLLELVDDPRGDTSTTVRTTVSSDPEDPGIVYEEVTETERKFQVSLMMGQRWEVIPNDMLYLGGRFGILESSGGLGANIWAFDDAFEARFDLFDFSENDKPRLRMYGLIYGRALFSDTSIFSKLFIQGGVDDVLNGGPRDYFIGAGLQFNDRDLRGILTVAPSPSF
jgi:phospholipid/cholesterol/gamma-HCH transport system substrate-binding protein